MILKRNRCIGNKLVTITAGNSLGERMPCELCEQTGGELLWRDEALRVVLVVDEAYPGFCRVIWQNHIKEMTDLLPAERSYCMSVVFAVEKALQVILQPDKINLASLGNVTPHLHWHVIPRWTNDRHYPNPIWTQPVREVNVRPNVPVNADALRDSIVQILSNSH